MAELENAAARIADEITEMLDGEALDEADACMKDDLRHYGLDRILSGWRDSLRRGIKESGAPLCPKCGGLMEWDDRLDCYTHPHEEDAPSADPVD